MGLKSIASAVRVGREREARANHTRRGDVDDSTWLETPRSRARVGHGGGGSSASISCWPCERRRQTGTEILSPSGRGSQRDSERGA
jgi:hypothetical protein